MKLVIQQQILEKFPDLIIGVVIAKNVNNFGYDDKIRELLNEVSRIIKEIFILENLAQHPLIKNWRDAYKKFGEKKDRASHESLIRRILKGREIPKINKLVDIYNYISLKYKTPVGGEDLDKIKDFIILKFADGNERFIELGKSEVTNPEKGEVIYADAEKVICRKWNWRESEEAKITEVTKNAIFVIDALHPLTKVHVEKACEELSKTIKNFCGGEISWYILDKEKPCIEF